jgi:hypothetical protein
MITLIQRCTLTGPHIKKLDTKVVCLCETHIPEASLRPRTFFTQLQCTQLLYPPEILVCLFCLFPSLCCPFQSCFRLALSLPRLDKGRQIQKLNHIHGEELKKGGHDSDVTDGVPHGACPGLPSHTEKVGHVHILHKQMGGNYPYTQATTPVRSSPSSRMHLSPKNHCLGYLYRMYVSSFPDLPRLNPNHPPSPQL